MFKLRDTAQPGLALGAEAVSPRVGERGGEVMSRRGRQATARGSVPAWTWESRVWCDRHGMISDHV